MYCSNHLDTMIENVGDKNAYLIFVFLDHDQDLNIGPINIYLYYIVFKVLAH